MFYLTTHSTHFIYGYMVKDHLDSEREETRSCHMGYSFRLASMVFYMHHPTDRIAHTMAFVTLVVEHWLVITQYRERGRKGMGLDKGED